MWILFVTFQDLEKYYMQATLKEIINGMSRSLVSNYETLSKSPLALCLNDIATFISVAGELLYAPLGTKRPHSELYLEENSRGEQKKVKVQETTSTLPSSMVDRKNVNNILSAI